MTNRPRPSQDASSPKPPTHFVFWIYRHARRVVVFVIGSTVLLIGIAMILLPGPAFIVIPLGLAILATEFAWARQWLDYAKRQIDYFTTRTSSETQKQDASSSDK